MTNSGHTHTRTRSHPVQPMLHNQLPPSAVADLNFLESWERSPAPGSATALRVIQIRRAHPELAAAIRKQCESKT